MSIADAAAAAVATFPDAQISTTAGVLPYPVVMVAIAGAESGWRDNAAGDAGLDPGFGLCAGFSSWGLWQVHNVHAAYLRAQTGSSSPCAWASWLYVPLNCARASLALMGASPSSAELANTWTTYADGQWRSNIAAAQAAVQAAKAGGGPPGVGGVGFLGGNAGPVVGLVLLGLLAAGAIGAGIGEEERAGRS